ncbi:hypothetical protein [Silvimonas sp.]|uniref:hypothetical protein n=1 Tax=Silvimonas sp. TaxID=2650811 RepID=UPI002849E474|nr:hypothetical protein [Silvimonas sp.]MDR3428920.1 hypothetical protein [Silvimonas sp.]
MYSAINVTPPTPGISTRLALAGALVSSKEQKKARTAGKNHNLIALVTIETKHAKGKRARDVKPLPQTVSEWVPGNACGSMSAKGMHSIKAGRDLAANCITMGHVTECVILTPA